MRGSTSAQEDVELLTHIDACAHRDLAVHKILEGEGEVAALVEHPVRSIVRLDNHLPSRTNSLLSKLRSIRLFTALKRSVRAS